MASWVQQELAGQLGRKVHKVLPDQLASLVQLDKLVRLGQEETMVLQEIQDSLDHRVHLVLRDLEAIKVHKGNKEHKELKVT